MAKIRVIKVDGREEDFDKEKIVRSCMNAGATEKDAHEIADEIEKKVTDGMRTTEIRRFVLKELRKRNPEWADNWEFYDRITKGRITYEDGKFIVVNKGHLYLGWQVRDIGPKGLSHAEEVKAILDEMEEDLKHGISPRTIQARTYVLFMGVLRSKKMPKEEKEKAIKLINDFRQRHGWKPYEIKKPIE